MNFYICSNLLPHLMPFDGSNPHSVVSSIHHITEVQHMLQQVGVLVQYIPPYSPDFNPIEEAFSKVKNMSKSENDNRFVVEVQLLTSFLSTSQSDCRQWIKHCGIYHSQY